MPHHICVTCGTQFPESDSPPPQCPICEDDRQYRGHNGQRWTVLDELRNTSRNAFVEIDSHVTAIVTEPQFGIGQQAHLIQTPAGNVLWDCITLLDDATLAEVNRLGGLQAIAISHPHFFSTMVEWSRAFDVPVYLHSEHRPWVMRPDDAAIFYWDGDAKQLLSGVTVVRCGGHFPGSSVLHWAGGAGGRGALFTSDTIHVVADRRWVTFMYSYPNLIPLDLATVDRIVVSVEPFAFDRIYGSFRGGIVTTDAKAAVQRSADRYASHVNGCG